MIYKKTLTLVELLISLLFFGVIIFGTFSFDNLSRHMLSSTERYTKVLNDATYILDYIAKDAFATQRGSSVGDLTVQFNSNYVNNPLNFTQPLILCSAATCGNNMLLIRQDTNGNGRRDNADQFVGYAFDQNNHQIYRCENAANRNYCQNQADRQILSNNTLSLQTTLLAPNRLEINITLCHNISLLNTEQDNPADNPHITLTTTVYSFSTAEN